MSCSSKGCPIRVTDVGWGPKPSQYLVRDVSFSLASGDRLAIVGPNGAGKTTLLRCLYRGVTPLEGRVEIDGQDIWQMSARQVARRIAVVLQEMPGDFPFTVRDVVMMGRVPWREGLSGWSDQDRAEARRHRHGRCHTPRHSLQKNHLAVPRASPIPGEKKRRGRDSNPRESY